MLYNKYAQYMKLNQKDRVKPVPKFHTNNVSPSTIDIYCSNKLGRLLLLLILVIML